MQSPICLICHVVAHYYFSGLSRIPVLNSYARTPPIVWKIGWEPTPVGEPAIKLPPLPIDLMHDKEVLREFIFRINSIGECPSGKFKLQLFL